MRMQKTIPSLPVQDMHISCAYYTNKLGFVIRHWEKTFAIAVRDDVEIHLWAACDNSWKWRSIFLVLKPIWTGAETFISGTASCRIEVQGLEDLYDEYKGMGVLHSPETEIVEQYWGHKEFSAVDNHRNLLTFYEIIKA